MRIAIVHNPPREGDAAGDWIARSPNADRDDSAGLWRAADLGVLKQVELVQASLAAAGHETEILATDDAAELCRRLTQRRPDLVFNCCEAFAGRAALEMNVAALFELLDIPFTGSPTLTLGMALDKPMAKAVLTANGVATPAHVVVEPGQDPQIARHLSFPLIVKPAAEDGSIGIDDGSVVGDPVALAERITFVWREFRQPALVEEFLSGREFNVSLLAISPTEFEVLPIGEIDFARLAPGRPRIVGYGAKWDAGSASWSDVVARCPAALEPADAARVGAIALEAARIMGIRDYGRIDMRARDADQAVFVLEVNPNPDLSEDAGFMRAANASGRTSPSTICEIVERAGERIGLTASPSMRQRPQHSLEP